TEFLRRLFFLLCLPLFIADHIQCFIQHLLILVSDFGFPWNGFIHIRRIFPSVDQFHRGFRLPFLHPRNRQLACWNGKIVHFHPNQRPSSRNYAPNIISTAANSYPAAITVLMSEFMSNLGYFLVNIHSTV